MRLKDIEKFGASEADNDELLLECFEDHEAYISARDHKKFLIVGRKGSGKTAIFRKLVSDSQWDQFCYGHSFSDYPWFHHDKQKKSGVPETECYRYSWEYVILISIAKLIINSDSNPWSEESLQAMARLESFIIDSYGSKSPELKHFFAPETRLKLKPSLSIAFPGVHAGINPEQVDISYLPTIVYEVNDALAETVLKCLNPEHTYHICFDELDRGFTADDDNYRNRLSGLLIAARDFNRRVRQAGKKMSAVVFLRDDILRYLKFEDKNKIVEDFASTIEWDKSSTTKTLKELMEKRFSRVLGLLPADVWQHVFNEETQMPGRQSKYQYILDRTFKRPRDIIKFCNEILRSYKQSGRDDNQFQNSDIAAARDEYSRYAKRELVDEMHQHFPQEQQAFDMIRVAGCLSFTASAFQRAYDVVAARSLGVPPASTMLRQLYDFSVIAFLKVGGSGGGSEWVWKYQDTEAEYDDRATIFRVHSGLKEVLELKQGRATTDGEEDGTDVPAETLEI